MCWCDTNLRTIDCGKPECKPNIPCAPFKPACEETVSKPPLGAVPEKLWLLLRCQDLSRAIYDNLRVDNIKYDLVCDWLDELQEHLKGLSGK